VAGAVTVSVTVTVGVTVGEGEVTPGVGVWVEGVVAPEAGVLAPEAGAMLAVGVRLGTVGVEADPLQAETATGASRVRAPQDTTVSLARNAVPATVVRTFMGPPHAPGR